MCHVFLLHFLFCNKKGEKMNRAIGQKIESSIKICTYCNEDVTSVLQCYTGYTEKQKIILSFPICSNVNGCIKNIFKYIAIKSNGCCQIGEDTYLNKDIKFRITKDSISRDLDINLSRFAI